jgi:hypothetical protein
VLWVWLGIIGFVVVALKTLFDDWVFECCEKPIFIILEAFGAFALVAVVIFIVSLAFSNAEFIYNETDDIEIIALNDNVGNHGHFYIMGGYSESELYYYYATETEFGRKVDKIKAEDSYVNYTSDTPHIEVYTPSFAKKWMDWFAMPLVSNRYIVYCPEGTMTTEFNIDLE